MKTLLRVSGLVAMWWFIIALLEMLYGAVAAFGVVPHPREGVWDR